VVRGGERPVISEMKRNKGPDTGIKGTRGRHKNGIRGGMKGKRLLTL
jgi:hypothetical protein